MSDLQAVELNSAESQALIGGFRLLQQHGYRQVAEVANRRLRIEAEAPRAIVVVGEVKRGKSTLVNALVGQRDVAPVSDDHSAGVFVRVRPPDDPASAGEARLILADGTTRQVARDELSEWITPTGARWSDPDAVPIVGADIVTPILHVPHATLVDTPGVGLNTGHARLARRMVEQASALVFTVDAGQPLTAPETRFLADASTTVDAVVFVLTKVDKHPMGWREVLAEDRQLLRRHVPRFEDAPIVPVSSVLALDALDADDELGSLMLDESGIPQLAELLRSQVQDAGTLPLRNALRMVRTSLHGIRTNLTVERDALAQEPDARAHLQSERARLADLNRRRQRWSLDLERDLGRLRSAAVGALTEQLHACTARWVTRLERDRIAFLPERRRLLVAELSSDLQAMADDVLSRFRLDLERALAEWLEGWAGAQQLVTTVAGTADALELGQPSTPRARVLADPTLVMTALYGVTMAGQFGGTAVGGAAAIFGPAGITIGAAWLAVNIVFRALRTSQQQLRSAINQLAAEVRQGITTTIDDIIRELKPELVVALRDHLESSIAELTRIIREADRAANASTAERDEQVAQLTMKIGAIDAQMVAIDDVLGVRQSP